MIRKYIPAVFLCFLCGCAVVQEETNRISVEETELSLNSETPDTERYEAEAVEEAEMVIEHLKGISLDLPVVYDLELIRDDKARTDHVTGEQFTKNTIAFCEKIKESGYEPMIYSNMYLEAFLFDLKELQDYSVWYADYEKVPQTPCDFTFWQYSESEHVDGIEGVTDLNVWFVERGANI